MKIILKIVLVGMIVSMFSGCIDSSPNIVESPPKLQELNEQQIEMKKLELFLQNDQTDKMKYDSIISRSGKFPLPGAIFARSLAENASNENIKMGAIISRNTMGVGVATQFKDPLNYIVINDEILFIDPRNDEIYSVDELLVKDKAYRYVSFFRNTDSVTSYGQRNYQVDLDLEGEINESELFQLAQI